MAFKKGMPNPNGGRKSLAVEMAKNQAIMKAWNKVHAEVDSMPVDKVALPLALRDMAKDDGNNNKTLILIVSGESAQRYGVVSNREPENNSIRPAQV